MSTGCVDLFLYNYLINKVSLFIFFLLFLLLLLISGSRRSITLTLVIIIRRLRLPRLLARPLTEPLGKLGWIDYSVKTARIF